MLSIYSEFRDIARDVISKNKLSNPKLSNFATAQLAFFTDRCGSSSWLWQAGRYWDCEIVMRSALECATRFIYVCIAGQEEREKRMEEFEKSLWEIDRLNASERAKPAVDASSKPEIEILIGGIILSEEEDAALRGKWPRKLRKSMAQKWSFSEMVREISSYNGNGLDLRKYSTLLHGYSISSHLIHADSTAISLVWDQNTRQKAEGIVKAKAHAVRLLSDQLTFIFLVVRTLVMATNHPIDSRLIEATRSYMKFQESTESFHAEFLESQRHRYKD